MGSGLMKWLSSLGTGALSVVLLYLQTHTADPTAKIDSTDGLVSFVVISLIAKGVSWLVSKVPASPTATTRR